MGWALCFRYLQGCGWARGGIRGIFSRASCRKDAACWPCDGIPRQPGLPLALCPAAPRGQGKGGMWLSPASRAQMESCLGAGSPFHTLARKPSRSWPAPSLPDSPGLASLPVPAGQAAGLGSAAAAPAPACILAVSDSPSRVLPGFTRTAAAPPDCSRGRPGLRKGLLLWRPRPGLLRARAPVEQTKASGALGHEASGSSWLRLSLLVALSQAASPQARRPVLIRRHENLPKTRAAPAGKAPPDPQPFTGSLCGTAQVKMTLVSFRRL